MSLGMFLLLSPRQAFCSASGSLIECRQSLVRCVPVWSGLLCLNPFVVSKGFCCSAGEAGYPQWWELVLLFEQSGVNFVFAVTSSWGLGHVALFNGVFGLGLITCYVVFIVVRAINPFLDSVTTHQVLKVLWVGDGGSDGTVSAGDYRCLGCLGWPCVLGCRVPSGACPLLVVVFGGLRGTALAKTLYFKTWGCANDNLWNYIFIVFVWALRWCQRWHINQLIKKPLHYPRDLSV